MSTADSLDGTTPGTTQTPPDETAVDPADAANAERQAAREAAKAERQAAREAAKAERKALREAAKAEREATRETAKAEPATAAPASDNGADSARVDGRGDPRLGRVC